MRGHCSACHYAGNGAAETYKKRNNAATGKTDFSEQLIRNKGNARHISAVLQKRKEKKQNKNYRNKAQYAAYAAEDSVNNQRMEQLIDADIGQKAVNKAAERIYSRL